jgi:hypothetical protein
MVLITDLPPKPMSAAAAAADDDDDDIDVVRHKQPFVASVVAVTSCCGRRWD